MGNGEICVKYLRLKVRHCAAVCLNPGVLRIVVHHNRKCAIRQQGGVKYQPLVAFGAVAIHLEEHIPGLGRRFRGSGRIGARELLRLGGRLLGGVGICGGHPDGPEEAGPENERQHGGEYHHNTDFHAYEAQHHIASGPQGQVDVHPTGVSHDGAGDHRTLEAPFVAQHAGGQGAVGPLPGTAQIAVAAYHGGGLILHNLEKGLKKRLNGQ